MYTHDSAGSESRPNLARARDAGTPFSESLREDHTCHILPPSELDWGLFLAVFTGLEGKHLFHRIG